MKVAYLKKIHTLIETGDSEDSFKSNSNPKSFVFIYGVGTSGISPFEKALFEKDKDEEVLIHVQEGETKAFFGHLFSQMSSFIDDSQGFYLKIQIESIQTPEDREVVNAIAGGSSADGCDCGCGCS